MNTQEVANRWVELCREGKNLDCVNELYAQNVISREMPGMPEGELVSGRDNILAKNREWLESVEEFHASDISEPIIADNHFTSRMTFDVTFKERGRQKMEELAVFEVQNGKITNEQFFYNLPVSSI